MTELRPPAKWAHLRWHWIYVPCSGIEPWQWERSRHTWLPAGQTVWHSPALFPSSRYHKPCDPAAIVPDPANDRQVDKVASAINDAVGENKKNPIWITHLARTALRALAEMKETGDV